MRLEVFDYIPFTVLISYTSGNYFNNIESLQSIMNHIDLYALDKKDVKYAQKFNLGFLNKSLGSKTKVIIKESHTSGLNLWIVKAVDLNRGRGIKICNSLKTISRCIKKFSIGISKEFMDSENLDKDIYSDALIDSSPTKPYIDLGVSNSIYKTTTVIIQKYIERPFLYYGRKCDMRIWVLLTYNMNVYVFKEGHLKTSSMPYNPQELNSFIHLTNYSVQKYNESFSKFEHGNEISFNEFQQCINRNENIGRRRRDLRKHVLPLVHDIVVISMKAAMHKINVLNRKFCYELFGYDFLMDEDLVPYLLEVNTNPGFDESSPWVTKLVRRMLEDTIRLTVDDLFGSEYKKAGNSVDGYSDEENMWGLICKLKSV